LRLSSFRWIGLREALSNAGMEERISPKLGDPPLQVTILASLEDVRAGLKGRSRKGAKDFVWTHSQTQCLPTGFPNYPIYHCSSGSLLRECVGRETYDSIARRPSQCTFSASSGIGRCAGLANRTRFESFGGCDHGNMLSSVRIGRRLARTAARKQSQSSVPRFGGPLETG